MNLLHLLAEEPAKASGPQKYIGFILLGAMVVIMIAMSIIPQKKRRKKQQDMMASLKPGTKIKTVGGIVGEIVAFDEAANTIILNIGRNGNSVEITIDRSAVYMVLDPADAQSKQADGKTVTSANPEKEAQQAMPTTQDEIDAQKKAEERAQKKAERKAQKEESKAQPKEEAANAEATAETTEVKEQE